MLYAKEDRIAIAVMIKFLFQSQETNIQTLQLLHNHKDSKTLPMTGFPL